MTAVLLASVLSLPAPTPSSSVAPVDSPPAVTAPADTEPESVADPGPVATGAPTSTSMPVDSTSSSASTIPPTSALQGARAIVAEAGVHENGANTISLTGTWQTTTNSKDSGGSVAYAKITGDSAEITFTGSSIAWIARTGPALGIAEVKLDGTVLQSVDLYASVQEQKKEIFRSAELQQGSHTFSITRTGTRNASSRGNDIALDAFIVVSAQRPEAPSSLSATLAGSVASLTWKSSPTVGLSEYRVRRSVDGGASAVIGSVPASTLQFQDPSVNWDVSTNYTVVSVDSGGAESAPSASASVRLDQAAASGSGLYEETSAAITRIGTWNDLVHSSDSGRGSANAKAIGDYAQFMFRGTGVQWIGRKGPSLGKADVYLDGVKTATVDLYSSTQVFQQKLFERAGLADGTHTIRLVRTGAQNSSSKGKDISLDALRVVDTTPPPTPGNVSVTAQREGLMVKWPASTAADTVGYIVYRAKGSGTFDKITVGDPLTETSFLDIGLDYGVSYRYTVAALDSSGNMSGRSAVVTRTQPKTVDAPTRLSDCPATGKTVSTLTQLRDAVAAAKPGTVIRLAPGTYRGGITVTRSGTASAPIWICGPRTAVLDNGNLQSKNGVLLQNVSNVNVAGFTIQNFRKGVVVSASTSTSVADLSIRDIGEEAIKVRYSSASTVVQYNTIRNTGRAVATFGEGIYLGTSPQNWCELLDCKPDATTLSQVVGNDIAGTTADPIEAKPGTTSGVIRGNKLDGAALTDVTNVLAVKGNDYLVVDNVGTNAKASGVIVMEGEVAGNGSKNFLARNSIAVPRGQYAIFLGSGSGNVVDCTNLAPTAGSIRSNATSCQK